MCWMECSAECVRIHVSQGTLWLYVGVHTDALIKQMGEEEHNLAEKQCGDNHDYKLRTKFPFYPLGIKELRDKKCIKSLKLYFKMHFI